MQFTLQRKLSPLNFLTHPVYNINKMQDFSSKTTFIIIWIVYKSKNNDTKSLKIANKIVFLQEQNSVKRTENKIN